MSLKPWIVKEHQIYFHSNGQLIPVFYTEDANGFDFFVDKQNITDQLKHETPLQTYDGFFVERGSEPIFFTYDKSNAPLYLSMKTQRHDGKFQVIYYPTVNDVSSIKTIRFEKGSFPAKSSPQKNLYETDPNPDPIFVHETSHPPFSSWAGKSSSHSTSKPDHPQFYSLPSNIRTVPHTTPQQAPIIHFDPDLFYLFNNGLLMYVEYGTGFYPVYIRDHILTFYTSQPPSVTSEIILQQNTIIHVFFGYEGQKPFIASNYAFIRLSANNDSTLIIQIFNQSQKLTETRNIINRPHRY